MMADGSLLRSRGETWGPVSPENVQETGVSPGGRSGSDIVAAEAEQVERTTKKDLVTLRSEVFVPYTLSAESAIQPGPEGHRNSWSLPWPAGSYDRPCFPWKFGRCSSRSCICLTTSGQLRRGGLPLVRSGRSGSIDGQADPRLCPRPNGLLTR
jgi:hypothetical protein